jgi:hypothetical protein
MSDIENGAKPYKVGKRVGSRAKVKNATKVSAFGLDFDTKLEYNCYLLLKDSGIDFIFKPERLLLVPKFTAKVLDHTEENAKALAKMRREAAPDKKYMDSRGMDKHERKLYTAECRRDQSRIKRLFNVEHRKVVRDKTILPLTWAPDFYLPEYDMYVEAKGFANDSFPLKFKIARYLLRNGMSLMDAHAEWDIHDDKSAIEVGSKKELEDLIKFLKNGKK